MSGAVPKFPEDLLGRLPRTFASALNDKLRQWDVLFPAEQRLIAAQIGWLSQLPPADIRRLFAPVVEIESRMALPRLRESGLSINDSAILARSPEYPLWRGEAEKIFARIEAGVDAGGRLKQFPRLILCILPAGLPLASAKLWPSISSHGFWLQLKSPFGENSGPLVRALATRKVSAGLEQIEGSWALTGQAWPAAARDVGPITILSWPELAALRADFLARLNTIRKDLRSADETNAELQRANIRSFLPAQLRGPRIREFVRALLLSGNGGLVFANSFVQWGATETLRRVQPQVLVACFGIRNKPKPFSSVLLLEDQNRANPVADEPDPEGSLVDAQILAEYVFLAADRLAPYHGRTITIIAAEELDRILVLAPPEASGLRALKPGHDALGAALLRWLEGGTA